MERYIIRGGNGWSQELWCHRAEAIATWKRIGGNTKLFVVKDGHEFTVLVNDKPKGFRTNPFAAKQAFDNLFKAEEPKDEEPKIEEPAPLPQPEAEPATEEEYREPYINPNKRPTRSWFAFPSY